jgi:hypothetical protein
MTNYCTRATGTFQLDLQWRPLLRFIGTKLNWVELLAKKKKVTISFTDQTIATDCGIRSLLDYVATANHPSDCDDEEEEGEGEGEGEGEESSEMDLLEGCAFSAVLRHCRSVSFTCYLCCRRECGPDGFLFEEEEEVYCAAV